jgi:hypothetical protein
VQDRITRHEQALVEGLRAVNVLAEAVENRLEELTAEISTNKLAISEARLSDVQRSLDRRGVSVQPMPEEIPKFLS